MLVKNTNEVQYTNAGTANIEAGTGIQVGDNIFGVLQTNIAPGETGTLAMFGIWTLPIASSTTASAGDLAYWDKTNGKVLASGTSKLCIGAFTKGSANGETETEVSITPTYITSAGS